MFIFYLQIHNAFVCDLWHHTWLSLNIQYVKKKRRRRSYRQHGQHLLNIHTEIPATFWNRHIKQSLVILRSGAAWGGDVVTIAVFLVEEHPRWESDGSCLPSWSLKGVAGGWWGSLAEFSLIGHQCPEWQVRGSPLLLWQLVIDEKKKGGDWLEVENVRGGRNNT